MKYIALIPARKGSKEIPEKNIMYLSGKPLIVWTIEQAIKSKKISRVIVSTDCKKIAEISKNSGAEVPFLRPTIYSQDNSSTESVLLHAIEKLEIKDLKMRTSIVLLQPTSPIRFQDSIDQSISKFEKENADSLVSVNATKNFFWKNKAIPLYDFKKRSMRQNLKKNEIIYKENGSIYISKVNILLKNKNRLGGKITIYEMKEDEGHEVDSLKDFENVKSLISRNKYFRKKMKISEIDAIIFDFDGVLTNNYVYISSSGIESVRCNRSDGHSFKIFKDLGLRIFILSSETNKVVKKRAEKLNVKSILGSKDKIKDIHRICKIYNFELDKIIYVGNDINDLEAMKECGISLAVNDAIKEVKQVADFVLLSKGGEMVAREILNEFLEY